MTPTIHNAIESLMLACRDYVPGAHGPRIAARAELERAISAAILAEREACAVIAESDRQHLPEPGDLSGYDSGMRDDDVCALIAHHIRNRPAP